MKIYQYLLEWEHAELKVIPQNAYVVSQRECQEFEIPLNCNCSHFFFQVFQISMEGDQKLTSFNTETTHFTLESQKRTGFNNMIVGFMSNEWTTLLDYFKVEFPQAKMVQILVMLWYHIWESQWKDRNSIHHSKSNHTILDELTHLKKATYYGINKSGMRSLTTNMDFWWTTHLTKWITGYTQPDEQRSHCLIMHTRYISIYAPSVYTKWAQSKTE